MYTQISLGDTVRYFFFGSKIHDNVFNIDYGPVEKCAYIVKTVNITRG